MEENNIKNEPIEIYPTRRDKIEDIPIEVQRTLNDDPPYITKSKKIEVPEDQENSFTIDLNEFKEEPKLPIIKEKPKPTYSQNWSAYNNAKTNECIFFKKLLDELLFLCIEEPLHNKAGRKGYSLRDKIFCMCIKLFYKSDLRKTKSILDELVKLGYIQKAPTFVSIDNFFNDESHTNILDDLILISALPVAELNETGGIDATGFSVSQFERWNDYKWGKVGGKERIWRKAHFFVGCTNHIIVNVKVTEKDVADVSMFEEVIGNKTKYFKMRDFVMDKAYLSRKVIKILGRLGLNPFIPFKSNSTGKSRGCPLWAKMFKEFKYNNEAFMKRYHRRSNLESLMHVVKSNFGDHLATKSFIANTNEIKTMALCCNLTTLIQEAFESNITIDFESCKEIAHSVK